MNGEDSRLERYGREIFNTEDGDGALWTPPRRLSLKFFAVIRSGAAADARDSPPADGQNELTAEGHRNP